MEKIRIIADDKIPFLKGALDEVADIQYMPGSSINKNDIKDIEALIIRTRTKCNSSLLEGSGVKFIATATIGHDHIDAEFCTEKGIEWTNAPGCNSSSVEQYITSVLLEMAEKHSLKLKNMTLGIIGVGNVGKKISRASSALGCRVLLYDPPRERSEGPEGFVSLDKIQSEADIITFHVPLNREGIDKTFHMLDRSFIKKLKKGTILMNTSRGEVFNELDLKWAIHEEIILDTVIDVWENEPEIDRELLKLSGISTPHIAGYSIDGKANGTMMSVRAVSQYFKLGLDHWNPDGLSDAEFKNIVVDCGNMNEQEIIHEVYRKTYEIMEDDRRLRNNPELFENLRGTYPVRREPAYFTVRLNNNPFERLEKVLEDLQFTVLELDCFC